MKIAHNPIVRKGVASLQRVQRACRRAAASPEDYAAAPPVLCNSFPKSGTHLLMQVLGALPGARAYGSFLASVPSVRFRMRPPEAMRRRIQALAPGEIAGAHLYHDPAYEQDLRAKNAAHFFIYRDPRAVVVSETHYLTRSAWWHGMHRRFAALETDEERLLLSIRGLPDELPDEYPSIRGRYERYTPWITSPDVCAVRFEEMRGAEVESPVRRIVDHFAHRSTQAIDVDRVTNDALDAIQPEKSHTFRSGQSDAWRKEFTPRVAEAFDEVAGDLLQRLGYAGAVV